VADLHGVELSGFIAWLTWLLVHLFYLIGVQNRLVVFTRWSASFLTDGRSSRIITTIGANQAPARPGLDPVAPERNPLHRRSA
jgi:NADH dehydrogenase